jgi:hypothetical protein
MSKSAVQRVLEGGRENLQDLARESEQQRVEHQKQQQAQVGEQVQEIASWLTQRTIEEYEDSLRVSRLMEQGHPGLNGRGAREPNLGGLWFERKVRLGLVGLLARLHGVDPIRREMLELKRKSLTGDATLANIVASLQLEQIELTTPQTEELARWLAPPPPDP